MAGDRTMVGEGGDNSWSSRGLPPHEAFRTWRTWACATLAPMHIEAPDESCFSARRRSRSVGALQLIELVATPQRVIHISEENTSSRECTFQLVYCKRTPMATRIGPTRFDVSEGEFVLI